jgi:hypothetical protein
MTDHQLLFNAWRESQPMCNQNTINNYVRMILKYKKWTVDADIVDDLAPNLLWTCPNFHILFTRNHIKQFLDAVPNLNTKSSYCAVICSYLNYFNGDSDLLQQCRDWLTDIKIEIGLESEKHVKTEIQTKNWKNLKQIRKIINRRGKYIQEFESFNKPVSKLGFIDLQKYIIQMLYMGFDEHPPVRCNYTMEVVDDDAPFPSLNYKRLNNYIVRTSTGSYFIFNKFKTCKRYGSQVIKIHEPLLKILLQWFKYLRAGNIHTDEGPNYLLYNSRFNKLSDNMLASYIPQAFAECQSKLTVDTLRHIFISDVCNLGNSSKYAKLMMHSTLEQANYWKN